MAEYIHKDDAINLIEKYRIELPSTYSVGLTTAKNAIKGIPTADVVPKSEVKELQAKLATLRKENVELLVSKETDIYISMEKLVKARTEHPIFKAIEEKVAREIFEEIEKTVFADMDFFKELKKKYEAEASQN